MAFRHVSTALSHEICSHDLDPLVISHKAISILLLTIPPLTYSACIRKSSLDLTWQFYNSLAKPLEPYMTFSGLCRAACMHGCCCAPAEFDYQWVAI